MPPTIFFLLIDDTQEIDEKVLRKVVYQLGNGTGKLRGAKAGGLRDTMRWRTVGLFTGEDPIISSVARDGMDMRVVELRKGLDASDEEAVHTFLDGVKTNHGVFAPILNDWIIHNIDRVREIHAESIATIKNAIPKTKMQCPNMNIVAVADRLAGTFASILTAGRIFEDLYAAYGGTKKDPAVIVISRFLTALSERSVENLATRGIDHVRSWIAENRSSFLINGAREIIGTESSARDRPHRVIGDIREDAYYILPSVLKDELERTNFDFKGLTSVFVEAGYLLTDPKEKKVKTHRTNEWVSKTYAFKREVIDMPEPDSEKKV